jgi:hypothetical protein
MTKGTTSSEQFDRREVFNARLVHFREHYVTRPNTKNYSVVTKTEKHQK